MRPALLRWTVLVGVAIFAVAAMRATQSAPAGGTIQGRTINALTGEPVRGALVQARFGGGPASKSAAELEFLSGLDGRFILTDLLPGTYGLIVTKAGYVTATNDQALIDRRESNARVDIALVPEAVISGTVVDQNGEPLTPSVVEVVLRGRPFGGMPEFSATTDSAGRYSAGSLPAGEYVVAVGRESRYMQLYYPAAIKDADATPIAVKAGEERAAIDFIVPGATLRTFASDPDGSGTIAGFVRDGNGRGLSQVYLVLGSVELDSSGNPRPGRSRVQLTDANGQFRFEGLRGGRFRIVATRPGYLQAGVGSSGMAVDLPMEPSIRDVPVTMSKLLTISGTVRDHYGDPISASVTVSPASEGEAGTLRTAADSRGRFSVVGLRPGEYLVGADSASAGRNLRMFDDAGLERAVAYRLTYYPGVTDSSLATAVTIVDRDISDLDLVLRPVPATTINVIVDPSGRKVDYAQLQVIALESFGSQRMRSNGPMDLVPVAFHGVAAGQYLLVASGDETNSSGGPGQRLWARQEIKIDGVAPQTVRLALGPGVRVSGRIVFEGVSTPPQAVTVNLRTLPPYDLQTTFAVQSSNTRAGAVFAIEDVVPGRYLLDGTGRADPQSPWTLKSVVAGGRDVFDLPFDLRGGGSVDDVVMTFTDRASGTEVTGTVTDAAGRTVADAPLVVFSSNTRYWRENSAHVRTAVSDPRGRYSIAGLPAGSFRVANLPGHPSSNVTAMLSKLVPDAVSFTLADGEHKVIDLRRVR